MDQTTKLAIMRTRLAAERTLMSWVRTSLAMITLGFGLIKFVSYLKDTRSTPITGGNHFGIFLILLGLFCLIPGIIEYRNQLKILHALDGTAKVSYLYFVVFFVALIGLYALAHVLAGYFNFLLP